MKSTGIVRKIDELGRIVLPRELRRTLNMNDRDPIEVFVENDTIILRKYDCCGDAIEAVDKLESYFNNANLNCPELLEKTAEIKVLLKR